ncbi:MAG: radical SAM protein [Planctomycetes bacterium]|nr:radical SAM protein [Planctomycetota bacterium]
MSTSRRRIVLYYPHQIAAAAEPPFVRYLDELPLALLSIAGGPIADGYEVVLVDGTRYAADEAHRRVLEACDGALLYATTGILGHQVADGLDCTRRVKARFPELPSFIGGWFASVAPELQLATGLYDAVAIGQGEFTFRELVAAVDSGAALEQVGGLALQRDGRVVRTAARSVTNLAERAPTPWHLVDFELYRAPQLRAAARRGVHGGFGPVPPRVGISYVTSFGCPLKCTFCCSPVVSGARWKARAGAAAADELAELQARWGFDGVHFHDANFGVSEPRMRVLADGLLRRGARFTWLAYMQAESILRYAPDTLDLLVRAGMDEILMGAEVGDSDAMERVRKNTRPTGNLDAAVELDRRGVHAYVTYILGFPGEDEASMRATLDEARRVVLAAPRARPEVWPYRPIPGAADWEQALELGYVPPATLEDWGRTGDYWSEDCWPGRIPPSVARERLLFMHYSSLAQGRVRQRMGAWERRARRRLEDGSFRGAGLEARAFHVLDRLRKSMRPVRSRATSE